MRRRGALGLLAAPLAGWGCGYSVAGKATAIPNEIRSIAVPPFENSTTEYKIEQYVTHAVKRELLSRTRYAVVNRENDADATLHGSVVFFLALPQNFDPESGRATAVMTLTRLHVSLWDRRRSEQVYENPQLEHRERYEVSFDPEAYFEERQAALLRSSQSMARTLVSAVLEGF